MQAGIGVPRYFCYEFVASSTLQKPQPTLNSGIMHSQGDCGCGNSHMMSGYAGGEIHSRRFYDEDREKLNLLEKDATYVEMQLNSYREENGRHEYAVTFQSLTIEGHEFRSRSIISDYFFADSIHSIKPTSLKPDNDSTPFEIEKLEAYVKPIDDFEVFVEDATQGPGLIPEKHTGDVFHLVGSVSYRGISYPVSQIGVVPQTTCFRIVRKCFWSECGPSWAHYRCHFRCMWKSCGNYGPCPPPGPWNKGNSTFTCSAAVPFC